ncbi:MAG: hypothetical protein WAR38_16390 [Chitinophagaceae bacterium]
MPEKFIKVNAMAIKKKPADPQPGFPYPGKRPEIDPDTVPDNPVIPGEEPDIIPDDDPFETPPEDVPPPGEKP